MKAYSNNRFDNNYYLSSNVCRRRYKESLRYRLYRMLRIRRVRVVAVLTLLAIIGCFGVVKSSNTVQASSSKEKKVKSIKLEKGDTLWSIASEYADSDAYSDYNEYICEVKRINNLSDSYIIEGSYLVVPYYE